MAESQNEISFSYNWNNKLQCHRFTTIRAANPAKYKIGNVYDIKYKDQCFQAQIIDIRTISLDQINEFIGGVDTGYSAEEAKTILRRMYKDKADSMKFMFMLLRRVHEQQQT